MEHNELFSNHVCNPCARKIRNLGALYELVLSSIGSEAAACKTPPKQRINTSNARSYSKHRRAAGPCHKSVCVNSANASRRFLFASTAEQSQQTLKDYIDSNLNIDDLPTNGTLQVNDY